MPINLSEDIKSSMVVISQTRKPPGFWYRDTVSFGGSWGNMTVMDHTGPSGGLVEI